MDTSVTDFWTDDVLKRRADAEYLHAYLVNRHESGRDKNGFVLGVNAEWGIGKTFMLERWRKQASASGHPAVYFDAWKNDFSNNPLLAFISELEQGLAEHLRSLPLTAEARKKINAVVKRVWKPALTILLAATAKQATGLSLAHLKEIIDDDECRHHGGTAKAFAEGAKDVQAKLQDAFKKALEPHQTTQAAISTFKEKLSALVAHFNETQEVRLPIFIFVDELDRCRPDYAIELLESIKHLFGIDGVYFVVSTNMSQLGESIRSVYGAGFDGQRYLRRFFDLQYTLPEPSHELFVRSLLRNLAIPPASTMLAGIERYDLVTNGHGKPDLSGENILTYVLTKHAEAFDLTLRDIRQITTVIDAALYSMPHEQVHIFLLVFLAVLYHSDVTVFNNVFRSGKLDETSGFQKIYRPSKRGLITWQHYDDNGRPTPRTVSVAEVAEVYVSNLRRDSDGSHNAVSSEFPQNLLNYAGWNRKDGRYQANYAKYFNIIQSAGGFVGR